MTAQERKDFRRVQKSREIWKKRAVKRGEDSRRLRDRRKEVDRSREVWRDRALAADTGLDSLRSRTISSKVLWRVPEPPPIDNTHFF